MTGILDIGFVGLGVMGTPMAGHLARAGHRLRLHDARPGVAQALAQSLGGEARACDTPAALAEGCDIVITMLPSGAYVSDVALGERGLIEGFQPGALLLDTSSSEPWLTRRDRRGARGARRGHGRRACLRCSGRRGSGRARVHGGGCGAVGGARLAPARGHGQAGVPSWPRRRGTRDEVHQQPHHRPDVHGDGGRPHHRGAIRPRPGGHDRRAERLHRDVVDQPDSHQAAHHQPSFRRPLQARADGEGRGHRHAAGHRQLSRRAAVRAGSAALAGGRPGHRPGGQHHRDGALGWNSRPAST